LVLGLAFCVTITIVGVTGALYSYADDIRDYERAKYLSARKTTDAKALSVEEISARFLAQKPSASIRFFSVRNLKGDLNQVGVSAFENGGFSYYEVNQYTGEIITNGLISDKFFTAVMIFHRFLSFDGVSAVGKQIVAATTIAIMVLAIGGFLLYLPTLKRRLFKSLRIEFEAKGYKFLYQLHAVVGVFTLVFVAVMCLTGLWWSYEWYRNLLVSLAGSDNAIRARMERREMASGDPKEMQETFDIAKEIVSGYRSYFIRVPFKDMPYELSYANARYGAYNMLKIDVQNAKIVSKESYQDKTIGQKLIQNIYALHSGQFFGEIGKALWALSSLAMALFSVSGVMMYYKKIKNRRKNRNVSPRRAKRGVLFQAVGNLGVGRR
jgi:sulfite reductase (NADPH) flavoprotein alpha-component